jgi:hypothetical protein
VTATPTANRQGSCGCGVEATTKSSSRYAREFAYLVGHWAEIVAVAGMACASRQIGDVANT